MKLVQYNGYLISTVEIDGLVLKHHDSYSAEYAPLCFQLVHWPRPKFSHIGTIWVGKTL